MPRNTSVLLLALLSLLLLEASDPEPAGAQTPRNHEGIRFFDTGPLRIREQFLLSQGFLAFEPTSADVLEAERWQVDFMQNVTNTG